MATTGFFDFISATLAPLKRRARINDDQTVTPWFWFDDTQFAGLTRDQNASGVAPVTNNAVTSQFDLGPFAPLLGRLINVTTTGSGTAQLLRSIDGGTTKLPVTSGGVAIGPWAAPLNEPVWVENEAGATFYLRLIPSSGTMTGRISQ